MKKTLILTAFAVFLTLAPSPAHAFDFGRLIDPACIFACGDDSLIPPPSEIFGNGSDQDTYNYSNSNNVTNSNNITNSNVNSDVNTTNNTPTYDYDDDYNGGSLGVSCYPYPSTANVDDTVIWRASPYGGNGNYHISWSGSNGLSGNGTNITKRYSSEGTKNASVTVTSGSRTVSRNCSPSVRVDDYDDNDYDDDYDYDDDRFSVSCSADMTYVSEGSRVTWRAYVSGGNGNYRYEWDGDEGLNGDNKSETITYDDSGVKRASVEVRSGGRTVNRSCSNSVTVGASYNYNQYPVATNIQIACYPDKTSARIGTPVTWSAEAVGGSGTISYSWIGTGGLSGNGYSAATAYETAGTKSATVTVTDAAGRTASKACGSTVYVQGAVTAKPVVDDSDDDSDNDYSAAALFSVENIPWGWVMVLVILVLLGAVTYLIFNRNKV